MLLLYYELPKTISYVGIETYQVTNREEIRNKLKQYYDSNSGKDKIIIGIHDVKIDDNDNSLVDLVRRYIMLPFVELYIVYPVKDYSEHAAQVNMNLVIKLDKNIQKYVEHYSPRGVRLHAIDDVSYFFYGLDK